jgi:hypothetical protein
MTHIVPGYAAMFTNQDPYEANYPGYGQLYISCSADATAKRLEN